MLLSIFANHILMYMVMLLWIIFAFIVGVVVGLIIARSVRGLHREIVSFKDAVRENGMPIVTFWSSGRELRFLIDTGAFSSCISKEILQLIPHTKCRRRKELVGIGGSTKSILREIQIEHGRSVYKLPVWGVDSSVFSTVSVKIDGILGNDFMEHYGITIDYISQKLYFDKVKPQDACYR